MQRAGQELKQLDQEPSNISNELCCWLTLPKEEAHAMGLCELLVRYQTTLISRRLPNAVNACETALILVA